MSFPIRTAPAERAVPPGRIGYDLKAESLLLHTLQPLAAFEELTSTGVLRPDPRRADPTWPGAYDWMFRMMNERLPTSGEAALWFWAKTLRATLVTSCRYNRGSILLTCRIPRQRVLLSHFSAWHSALNGRYDPPWTQPGETEEERDARWDREYDEFRDQLTAEGLDHTPSHLWPTALREKAEKSWEYIFDVGNFGRADVWQATTHELYVDDVVEAVHIST